MRTITVDVPAELGDRLAGAGERLPELLALSLHQPALPAQLYRTVLDFLATAPAPDQIAAFSPTPELQERLQLLLTRSHTGDLTPTERAELDVLELIEHVIIMLNAGALSAHTRP